MAPFRRALSKPTWQNALALVAGTVLAPGRRTVSAALRSMGLDTTAHFTNYHRVLNRNRWSSRLLAHQLLTILVARFVATGPVVTGIDDHSTPLGTQDPGARDLSRPGSVEPWSLRQGERAALALGDAAGSCARAGRTGRFPF